MKSIMNPPENISRPLLLRFWTRTALRNMTAALAAAVAAATWLLAGGQPNPAENLPPTGDATVPGIADATRSSPSASSTTSTSDTRLITQPRILDGAASLIARLRPRRFLQHNGRFDSQGRVVLEPNPVPTMGVLAQEVYPVIPEAVYRPADESREFWAVDYPTLVPVLVRAVQEQQATLQSQSSRIQNLEALVGGLEEELRKLKEFTLQIDGAARTAFNSVRGDLNTLTSKVSGLDSKASCDCTK